MELERLITAFQSYMEIRKKSGDLSNIDPKDILDLNNPVQNQYRMKICTSKDKQEFDRAKQEIEDILNSYIDKRIKTAIESMKNNGE